MSRKRRAAALATPQTAPARQPTALVDRGATVAAAAIAFALLAGSLAVDTRAEAAFDAPKRLLVLGGVAVAAAALFAPWPAPGTMGPPDRWARLARIFLIAALAGACVSALVSPRPGVSLDALRTLLLL